MPRIRKDKVRLEVLIDRKVYEMLVNVAPSLYGAGKYRGALSYVVEQALRAYLTPRLHTRRARNQQGKVRSVFNMVLNCIAKLNGGFIPNQVLAEQLTTCISNVRGSDPRTIRKWLDLFTSEELIKDLTPDRPLEKKVYEIVAAARGG